MSNNLFNILVFLFIMVASGIYTLYFISKADIIKYHKEKGIKAIIPIVGEYTLFKNAFGKNNALLTYLLTNVLPIATYLTFCTVIKNITIFWLIMTLPILISIYLRYRRNTVLFNKCYGFGKVSSILSLIFPKATFIFVYLFGKNSFHGPKTPMNKSKAKKIRTIASILLLTVSLNSLFGVTSNAEPLQEEGTQVTEEVIDDEEIIEEPVEEEIIEEDVNQEPSEEIDEDLPYLDPVTNHMWYHGKDLTITPNDQLTEEELYYKIHFDDVQQEASPETIAKIKAKRQWLIDNGINNRATTNKFLYLYIGMVDNTTVLTVNDTLEYLDDKYCQGVDAHNLYIYYTRENGKLIRHNGCFNCLLGFEDVVDKPLDGEEHLIPLNENKSYNDTIKKSPNNNSSEAKKSYVPTNTLKDYKNYYYNKNYEALEERPNREEEFEARKRWTAGINATLIGMNYTLDVLTTPISGLISGILGNSKLKLAENKILDLAGLNKVFLYVDLADITVDILLALLHYYTGDYTKEQLKNQLGNKLGSFIVKKIKFLPKFIINKIFKKDTAIVIYNETNSYISKNLNTVKEETLDYGIEKIFSFICPEVSK